MVSQGGLEGGRIVFKVPLLISQQCAVHPLTLPQAPAGLCQGHRPTRCCHLCIPTVAFGKKEAGWALGSAAQKGTPARTGGESPGPRCHPSPAPKAVAHRFVTCLQGPEMESFKCYI